MFKHGWKIGKASFKSPTYFDNFFKRVEKQPQKNPENTKQ